MAQVVHFIILRSGRHEMHTRISTKLDLVEHASALYAPSDVAFAPYARGHLAHIGARTELVKSPNRSPFPPVRPQLTSPFPLSSSVSIPRCILGPSMARRG